MKERDEKKKDEGRETPGEIEKGKKEKIENRLGRRKAAGVFERILLTFNLH